MSTQPDDELPQPEEPEDPLGQFANDLIRGSVRLVGIGIELALLLLAIWAFVYVLPAISMQGLLRARMRASPASTLASPSPPADSSPQKELRGEQPRR